MRYTDIINNPFKQFNATSLEQSELKFNKKINQIAKFYLMKEVKAKRKHELFIITNTDIKIIN